MSNHHQYALLIGVGQRPDDEPALAITAADAGSMYEKLTGTCGFAKENVMLQTAGKTSGNQITDQIDLLINQTQKEKADLVLVFFSGHGYTKDNNYYLIQYDTDKNNIENTAINGDVFISKINQINTNKLLLLLDCCHAGGFAAENKTLTPFNEEDFIQKANRVIITSSEKWEKSFTAEPVSVFTYALIEALHGKDLKGDKSSINVFDLALYVRERTRALTKNVQNPGFNVLPQSFTENFAIVDYQNNKPAGLAFQTAFRLYKDGKEVAVANDFSEGEDRAFRELWCKKLNIQEADIGFIRAEKMDVKNVAAGTMEIGTIKAGEVVVTDKAKEEIIKNQFLPIKIRIEKDRVVYGWKKNTGGKITEEFTEVKYSDADLHLNVSDFFIQWAKAVQQYDDSAESNFQILGKLLARFIDLENQLNSNLNLSETLFLEPDKNVKIGVMLEVKSDAGSLCSLPWEYLFITEKSKESITGKQSDYTKKYPSFFLAADKGMQVQFVRQTKRNEVPHVYEKKLSVVVFNNSKMTEAELKERMDRIEGKEKIEAHIIAENFFKNVNDFCTNYFRYIKDAIENEWISENYVLHYVGEGKVENDEVKLSFMMEKSEFEYMSADTFAELFEQNEKHLDNYIVRKIRPQLIFLEANDSAKTGDNNNGSVSLKLSYNDIPAVLGFQDQFPAEARDEFINQFYSCIIQGMDVARAVTHARQSLKFSEWQAGMAKKLYLFGVPVLFISTKFPISLIQVGDTPAEVKKTPATTSVNRKYCIRCGKDRDLTNKVVCDIHRIRLEDLDADVVPEQKNADSNTERSAAGERRDFESLIAQKNNG